MLISDIETNGLLDTVDTFHCAFIYNTVTKEYKGYRPDDFKQYLQDLQDEVDNGGMLVFHNGIKYDIPALKILAEQKGLRFEIPENSVIDTLVLARLVYSNIKDTDAARLRSGTISGKMFGSHSLEAWGYRLGQMKGEYKYDFQKKLEEQGEVYEAGMEWLRFSEEMYDYCKQDVVVTYELAKKLLEHKWYNQENQWENIGATEFWGSRIPAVLLEHEAAWLMTKQERNGFPFDKDLMVSVYGELAQKRADILVKLQQTFGSWYRAKGGKDWFKHPKTGKELPAYPKVTYPKRNRTIKSKNETYTAGRPYTPIELVTFNPASRDHIALKLKEAGWTPTEFTEQGAPIVNDETLSHVKVDDPVKQEAINLIKTYLMVQKRIGQIAEGSNSWLNYEKNGFIHGTVNPNGAVTGRATHAFPNTAQVPSAVFDKDHNKVYGIDGGWGTECREAFGACHFKDKNGNEWVQAGVDASGLELRCLAHFMSPYDGGEYVDTILNGDIHSKNQVAAGLPTRNNAKTFNTMGVYKQI